MTITNDAISAVLDDTPETDDALHGVWYRGDHGSAIPALCRKLERERNALREAITEAMATLEQIPQGCVGESGATMEEIEAAEADCHCVEDDATYHTVQRAWLMLRAISETKGNECH